MRPLSMISGLLTASERRKVFWLSGAVLVAATFEMAGVASIMPFMAVLANPQVIHDNRILSAVYTAFGFEDSNRFLFFTGTVALALLVTANTFSALTNWALLRFSNHQGHLISKRLLVRYLSEPYVFFLNRNTSELSKNILTEVNRVVVGILIPGMQMFAKGIIVLFILILLLFVNPRLVLIVAIVLGGSYTMIFWLARRKLTAIGADTITAAGNQFQLASEALAGVKDIKVLGREREFIRRYEGPSLRFAGNQAASQAISQIPKYALEVVAFGGILLITLYLLGDRHQLEQVLPFLALYAFAGYRLMPALQFIFGSLTSIRYSMPALELIHAELSTGETDPSHSALATTEALAFKRDIEVRDLWYTYPNAQRPVIQGLTLSIAKNSTVGLVGATGSGKTTTIDILLGLLEPQIGGLFVDGQPVNRKNVGDWQRNLGYVSQHVYLSDDTAAGNIAFGIAPDDVDLTAVERAARMASIHDFIMELPNRYDTLVGERGARLSGGQRQRMAIARALYHNPDVLVLDEATSALDGITENEVMEAVSTLAGHKTIIMIAHRLATVRSCDIIFVLENGRLADKGNFDELISSNDQFRRMANES
jgi:ATP-binding cassette, subfamily B, bacterial PglK